MEAAWPGSHRTPDPQSLPQPLETRSRLAAAGLVTVAVCTAFWAVAALSLRDAAGGAGELTRLRGLQSSYDTWETIDTLGNLLAAGLFLSWFAVAYGNLRRLGVRGLPYSDGWAIGSWFVPFGSIWIPKRIANAIWRGRDADSDIGSESRRRGDVSPVLQWWWGLYLAGGFVALIGEVMVRFGYWSLGGGSGSAVPLGGVASLMGTGAMLAVVGGALLVPAAILGIAFVLQATERLESARSEAIAGEPDAVISCPECAELVQPQGRCRYCGCPV